MAFWGALVLAAVAALVAGCATADPGEGSDRAVQRPAADGDGALAGVASGLVERHGLPAVAVGVVIDGEVSVAVAGYRFYGSDVALDVDAPFHLGSNTKALTAALVGVLVEDGVLSLDASLDGLLDGTAMDPSVAGASLRDLLAHRAGLGDHVLDLRALHMARDVAVARGEVVSAAVTRPAGAPGSFDYANVNYVVAGVIAERATGQSWEQLVRGRVFAPLGVDCGFGAPTGVGAPFGHTARGEAVPDDASITDNPAALRPAGGVHCSIEAWARFVAAILAGIQGKDTDLLRASTVRDLLDGDGDYQAGWRRIDHDNGTLFGHDGSNTLWYARAVLIPDQNRALLIATNTGEGKAVDAMDHFTRDQLER